MGVTHVVRGSDHVTNTATQIQIIKALGGNVPSFAHHSLLTGAQGEALSKRIGSLSIKDFREGGAEPMAIISMMAALGSSQPVVLANSIEELSANFDLTHFGPAPTKFDPDEVKRLSTSWLRAAPSQIVGVSLSDIPEANRDEFWEMAAPNVDTRDDIAALWALVSQDATPIIDEVDADFVKEAMALQPALPWDDTTWKTWTNAVKDATGRKGKDLFLPLRKAVMGREHGPDMGKFMALRGKLL